MQIHFLRNATLIIQHQQHKILVDPMLGDVGTLPPFSVVRHKRRRNPIVPLPPNAEDLLQGVTAALVTHCRRGHSDHLDGAGRSFLAAHEIPTYCTQADASFVGKKGVRTMALKVGERQTFLDGSITPVPTVHGYGWIARMMGPGVGYLIELPGAPSLYVSGDTILTDDVRSVLTEQKPDVSIVAAGNASVDVGEPILMTIDDVVEFARLAPGRVVANHLQALNHCPTTREQLQAAAATAGMAGKIETPVDGKTIVFD